MGRTRPCQHWERGDGQKTLPSVYYEALTSQRSNQSTVGVGWGERSARGGRDVCDWWDTWRRVFPMGNNLICFQVFKNYFVYCLQSNDKGTTMILIGMRPHKADVGMTLTSHWDSSCGCRSALFSCLEFSKIELISTEMIFYIKCCNG